jgi:flagellin
MALTLGASHAASLRNMQYLNQSKSLMDKSLQRISSGRRILSPADDPGGLAFSMRLQNELTVNNAVQSAVANAKSFTEVQDSALKSAGDILTEMSSLQTKYASALTTDKAIYAGQFRDLQVQLGGLRSEELNGVSLFSNDSGHKSASTIYTSAQGASGSSITLGNLDYAEGLSISTQSAGRSFLATSAGTVGVAPGSGTGVALSISAIAGQEDNAISSTDISNAIEQIASLRAQSGGKSSVLGFASDYLATKSVSLESAHSRIMDADIAEESLNYSKYSLQYQAGVAALAQSNLSMEVVLDLLRFPSIRA